MELNDLSLFPEDLKIISDCCIQYPIGSNQIAEIVQKAAALQGCGIDVLSELNTIMDKYGIPKE